MFKSYLKITARNFQKNKVFSFINISGVAISIAACFLILKYAGFELSYDEFHKKSENIYRLTNDRYQDGKLVQHGVITYPAVAKTMAADFPEINNYTRLIQTTQMFVRLDENSFEENFVFADSAFLSMFTFPLITGNPASALARPYSILLSESIAEKYFGKNWQDEHIIGKVLNIDNRYDLSISGIFADIPDNSHMQFNILVSYSTLGKEYGNQMEDSWKNSNFMSYLKLKNGVDPKEVEQKFVDFSNRYFKGNQVTGYHEQFFLQPIKKIHLYSDYEYETWVHSNGKTVTVLILIAAFILIIAWLNYVNLSTASALSRAKEVGVRKAIGAQKSQLIKQFLFESALYNLTGLLIAIVFVELSEPLLRNVLNIQFSNTFISSKLTFAFLLLFLIGAVLSGLYPALFTSSFKTITVLKGKITNTPRGHQIRKMLVVSQFVLSFMLITGTFAIFSQIDFMMRETLGMNIEQTMVVQGPYLAKWDTTYFNSVHSFRSELLRYPAISQATSSQRLPGRQTGRIFNVQNPNANSQQKFTTADIGIGYGFFDTFEMKMLAGRKFDFSDYSFNGANLNSAILNRAAVRELGFSTPQAAYQQQIQFWGRSWEIIGVVENHHQQSLHVAVEPVIFTPQYSTSNYFFIKVNPANLSQTIDKIEQIYQKFFPHNPFNHFFLDEYFNQQYNNDINFRTVFTLFASLGILLSCMGLFGLVFFTTSQKTKEIGIRKTVGASTISIVYLLLNDLSRLLILSGLIAAPFTYYAISIWLSGYAYRIDLDFSLFIVPAIIVFIIALSTVSLQAVKAAVANPVKAIRFE